MSPADLPPLRALDRTVPGVFANLALDEALLVEADRDDGPAVLRTWELPEWAVVLGASCRIAEAVNLDSCRRDGVTIARRSSGGGAVVIGPGALNVTVVLPIASAPGIGAVDVAQRWVLGRIADQLRALGPEIEVLGSGDLALDRRKISGSAQRRLKRWSLVHATILYDLPASTLSRYLGRPPRRQPDYRDGRAHEDFVANLPLPRRAILEAVRAAWLSPGQTAGAISVPESLVAELVETKFADPGWIERF